MSKENKCVCCDDSIPEGAQTCKKCESESKKKPTKVKATAKIEEFKQWVYKHFIGVYIGIGVAICVIFLVLGIIIGQALPSKTEQPVVYTQSVVEPNLSANTTSTELEFVFRSSP